MVKFAEWACMAMKAMLNFLVATVAGLVVVGILILVVVVVVCTIQELKEKGKKDE